MASAAPDFVLLDHNQPVELSLPMHTLLESVSRGFDEQEELFLADVTNCKCYRAVKEGCGSLLLSGGPGPRRRAGRRRLLQSFGCRSRRGMSGEGGVTLVGTCSCVDKMVKLATKARVATYELS